MIIRRRRHADDDSSFTADRSYGVLGVSRHEGRLMVLVRDDHRLPVWTELSDFEVDDPELHAGWRVDASLPGEGVLQFLAGYRELVEDSEHYDALLEREPGALAVFEDRWRQNHGPLELPAADDFMSNFGVEPTSADGGDDTHDSRERGRVLIEGSDGHAVTLKWDAPARRLVCAWTHGDRKVAELTFPDTSRLSIRASAQASGFDVHHTGTTGRRVTRIQVYPYVSVADL
ncbi:hypothetical protein [Streptomyces sp. NPDC029554]|uniref:hypothetical protein n=1 Tax=Streptomyces sp. NPDC029554 TaxID=3155126 RepID=UPI0033C4C413